MTLGREHIQPVRFQGIDIGPFMMTVVVQNGETPLQAKRRGYTILKEMADDERDERIAEFLKSARGAQ